MLGFLFGFFVGWFIVFMCGGERGGQEFGYFSLKLYGNIYSTQLQDPTYFHGNKCLL